MVALKARWHVRFALEYIVTLPLDAVHQSDVAVTNSWTGGLNRYCICSGTESVELRVQSFRRFLRVTFGQSGILPGHQWPGKGSKGKLFNNTYKKKQLI